MNEQTHPFSFDVETADFEAAVLKRSYNVPIVVDFWASWCGPCLTLKPVLERLAAEYQGRFLLAKVDSDRNAELAGRYQVRGIPNVKAFHNGALVDEFSGAQPESAVRSFIGRLMPSPAEKFRQAAQAALAANDRESARHLLGEALVADPAFEPALLDVIEMAVDDGDISEARERIERLQHFAQDASRRDALQARIALASDATGNVDDLRRTVAQNPADEAARFDLANAEALHGRWREALDHLLTIVRRDPRWNDGAARKRMVDLFAMLGEIPGNDALIREYRVQLARALN